MADIGQVEIRDPHRIEGLIPPKEDDDDLEVIIDGGGHSDDKEAEDDTRSESDNGNGTPVQADPCSQPT